MKMQIGDAAVTDTVVMKVKKPPVFQGVMCYFPRALKEIAKVSAFGAEKYKKPLNDKGFLTADYPIEEFDNALMRHILDLSNGPINKADGNVLHRAQICWNALAALEKWLIQQEPLHPLNK